LEQELRIRFQPKQSELWDTWDNSDVTRIGFGGARMGAKSGGGRRGMLLRRLKYPRTTGLIIRRSLKELEQSHLIKLFEEYPALRSYYKEQKKQLIVPCDGGLTSSLFFGSAQSEKDMADFYSSEYADIMPDEAQEFSQGELEKLSGSNRCTSHPGIIPKMIYTFMPSISETGMPPLGLPYLKRVFKEGVLKGDEVKRKWHFIQAFGWDNIEAARPALWQDGFQCEEHQLEPSANRCQQCCVLQEEAFYSWSEEDRRQYFIERTDYGKTLAALSNVNLRDAWLYGKWDVFQGQYFPNFHPTKWVDEKGQTHAGHVLPTEEVKATIKPWHLKWLSMDWGHDHPVCVYAHSQDEKGRVITFGEIWKRGINEPDLGRLIGSRWPGYKFRSFVASADAGNLSERSSKDDPKSILQMITDALPKDFPRPFPNDTKSGTRVTGARLMSSLLDSGMWDISEDCPKLIECLPSLVRSPKNTEDVLKVDYPVNQIGDDPYDAARYGLAYMLGSSRRPQSEIIAEQARTIEDPVARALFIHKQTMTQQEMGRSVKPVSVPSWQKRI
jgi:hypothetical protein